MNFVSVRIMKDVCMCFVGRLSKEGIERMINDAEKYKKEDEQQRGKISVHDKKSIMYKCDIRGQLMHRKEGILVKKEGIRIQLEPNYCQVLPGSLCHSKL